MSAAPDVTTGWGVELQPAGCPHCRAVFLVPLARVNGVCPNCFAANLAPQPASLPAEAPELLAPFAVTPAQAAQALDQWARRVWLRPRELNASVLAGRLTPTFIPMWLVDGGVVGTWRAQMGYDYQVASAQEMYQDRAWTTRQVAETRVRWEPRAGEVKRRYENQTTPALDQHRRLMAQIGDFALTRSFAYSAQALQGACARTPNIAPDAARPVVEQEFNRRAEGDCQAAAGAQHVEHWELQAEYRDLNWTLLLLPLYTTAYTDEQGQVVPVLVHGQTGRISGVKRASQKQGLQIAIVFGLAALVLLLVGLVAALLAARAPLVECLALPALLLGFAGAVAAPIPYVWAWQYNRNNTP
ncbi:MAG: hypothetical protein WCF84_21650 [Anaerolineae bacterium]